jgi:hypothetical protein
MIKMEKIYRFGWYALILAMTGDILVSLVLHNSKENRNTIFSGVDMGRAFFISCEIWGTANKVSEIIKDMVNNTGIEFARG